MASKGFLITDPIGNVAYIPAGGEAAKIVGAAMKAGRGEIVCVQNSLKTVQRKLLSDYMKAKTDEEVRTAWEEWVK